MHTLPDNNLDPHQESLQIKAVLKALCHDPNFWTMLILTSAMATIVMLIHAITPV